MLAIPTTRTIGELARSVLRPSGLPEDVVVHVYLHDTDLVDRRRRWSLHASLVALARRRRATDLDSLATMLAAAAPETSWESVGRGGGTPGPQ
jgi:hypothetical protein